MSEPVTATTQIDARGAFTVGRRNGRWWFITPEGKPFFAIGMNHIDSSTLRYPENISIWRERYGNSEERWLKERVAPDLRAWGFNSVGWTQDVVVRRDRCHRHSSPFTREQYDWLGLPYCHLLPFAEIHEWEAGTRHPDFFSTDFEDWCDYVARAHCARMADDPKLIGYFYSDSPCWVHTTKLNEWKGPLFHPKRLEALGGREDLMRLATRYYRVTHDAVRRYDPRHLILGDRWAGPRPLPDEVLLAAKPFVDVVSIHHFGPPENVLPNLRRWAQLLGRPALLADNHAGPPGLAPVARPAHEWRAGYGNLMRALRETPECIGWHVTGAYLRNRVRQFGFRDEQENVDAKFIAAVTQANRETEAWVRQAAECAETGGTNDLKG
jgi:hypothetical protein